MCVCCDTVLSVFVCTVFVCFSTICVMMLISFCLCVCVVMICSMAWFVFITQSKVFKIFQKSKIVAVRCSIWKSQKLEPPGNQSKSVRAYNIHATLKRRMLLEYQGRK